MRVSVKIADVYVRPTQSAFRTLTSNYKLLLLAKMNYINDDSKPERNFMKNLILMASLFLSLTALAEKGLIVKEKFGGKGIAVNVFDDMSATISFDCAHGSVQAGRWPTGQSRISAAGTYTQESGVRPPGGIGARPEKAVYKANIDVNSGKMTLSVKVGTKRAVNYKLTLGQEPVIVRCM